MRSLSIGVALCALAAVGAQAIVGGSRFAFASLLLTLLPLSIAPAARAIALWALSLTAAASTGLLWQIAMGMALSVILAVAWQLPSLRPERPFAPGTVPVWPTLLVGGVTPIALVSWLVAMQPDLGDVMSIVPAWPPLLLVALGIGFTAVNAALEEILWRGYLQPHLAVLFGPVAAILLQAISFGVQHAHGVPRGMVGVLLAGIWAVMLGMLRAHTRGLLAPLLAHLVADATIAVIVLSRV